MILKDSKIKEHKLLGKPGLWDSYYMQICIHVYTYMGFPGSSAGKESACNAGDPGLILGSGRSPGEGIGYRLEYSWASLVAQTVKNPPAMQETWL